MDSSPMPIMATAPGAPPTAASMPATLAGKGALKRPFEEASAPDESRNESPSVSQPHHASGKNADAEVNGEGKDGKRPKKRRRTNKTAAADSAAHRAIEPPPPAPLVVKDEPMSPEPGELGLPPDLPSDPLLFPVDDDMEMGEVSTINDDQRAIVIHAMDENTILVIPEEFDPIPVLLLRAIARTENLRPESALFKRPCVFIVPSTLPKRLDLWLDYIANRCTLTIGVISTEFLVEKEAQETWGNLLTMDLIVTTSQALMSALTADLVTMPNFSLLLVDEVDLVHTHEAYKRLFSEYYKGTAYSQRPRVLGLTTQPINTSENFNTDVVVTEEALSARVWGVDPAVRDEVTRARIPKGLALQFDPPKHDGVTELFEKIAKIDEKEIVFRNNFSTAKFLVKELGPYAADMVWKRHAKQHEDRRNALVKVKERSMGEPVSFSFVEEARTTMIETVRNYAFPKKDLDPKSPTCNFSPKFLMLINILRSFSKEKDTFKGVVFVHKRNTANSLADVLRNMSDVLPFLKPRALVGIGAGIFDTTAEYLTKNQAVNQMREGGINLLISTSVGYDLELGPCSVVICFDVCEGAAALQMQQCRVRRSAKMFLILIEKGKERDARAAATLATYEAKGKIPQQAEQAPIKHPRDGGMDSDADDDDSGPYIEISGTNSKLYASDAAQALTRYVSIQEKRVVTLNCEYEAVDQNNRLFVCTILFPPTVAMESVTSTISPSKSEARRQAAFQACQELHKQGLLQPILEQAGRKLKRLTKASAKASIFDGDEEVSKEVAHMNHKLGTRCYPRKKPDLWRDSLNVPLDILHPVILYLDPGSEPLPENYRTMCLLTRLPIPKFPEFDLYFPDKDKDAEAVAERTAKVQFLHCAPIHVSEDLLQQLHCYTIRVCRAATSKPFICDTAGMSFFYAPMESNWTPSAMKESESGYDIHDAVAWKEVETAAASHYVPLDRNNLEEDIKDALVQDRDVEFTRRFEAVCMRPDLNPLSKPEDSEREQAYENLLEYCRARRKGFEGIQDENQPLIEVAPSPVPFNRLNPIARLPTGTRKIPAKYLIPELCVRYTLSASTYRTAMLLPSIMARLDEMLLVKELNTHLFDNVIQEYQLRVAITAPSVGCGYDYERYELLGDAYLKYMASIYLFVTCPQEGEGALHVLRQRIISNRALLFHSDRKGLPQYIQSKALVPRSWIPLNFRLFNSTMAAVEAVSNGQLKQGENAGEQASWDATSNPSAVTVAPTSLPEEDYRKADDSHTRDAPGILNTRDAPLVLDASKERYTSDPAAHQADDPNTQWLGDKCIADVAEAVIGGGFLVGGRDVALTVCKNLGLPLSVINCWADFRSVWRPPASFVIPPAAASHLDELQDVLGHRFKEPFYLAQAMTHSSASSGELQCYERLEFIGDAVLDFLVIRHIFTRYGELSPGSLTLLKGAMVCNSALAAASVSVGLHRFIRHESVFLANSIKDYVGVLTAARDAEYVLAARQQRPPGEYWLEHEPPKALSDVVESVLGAIYVSDGFDPTGYQDVFDRLFKPFFLKHVSLNTLSYHPTKLLFERFQARSCQKFEITKNSPNSLIASEVHCEVVCHGIVVASAVENTVVLASRHASAKALTRLDADPEFLDRTCNCKAVSMEKKRQKRDAGNAKSDSLGGAETNGAAEGRAATAAMAKLAKKMAKQEPDYSDEEGEIHE